MADDKTMRIGEVTERTSLSLRTLRHWEDAGLVAPVELIARWRCSAIASRR